MPMPIREVPKVATDVITARCTYEPNTGCWLWTGRTSVGGYGILRMGDRDIVAHRLSYVAAREELSTALELDHLCRQRSCVNPDHLEPVTPRVNWERGRSPARLHALKTHCKRGHPLTPDNVYTPPRVAALGRIRRECRACKYDPEVVHRHYLRKCEPGKSRHRPNASP